MKPVTRRRALFACLIAAAIAWPVVPAPAATVSVVCGAQTVMASPGTDSFSISVCGSGGVVYQVFRAGSIGLTWKITTNLASRTCSWPANSGTSCNGSGPIAASPGTNAAITMTATGSGVAVATWLAVF